MNAVNRKYTLRMTAEDVISLARPGIVKLKPYASAKDDFMDSDKQMIYIDANENPYENGMNRYPDPNQTELRKQIARIKGVSPDNILLGNGSDEILDLIFRVFAEPGRDNVIVNKPGFGMFRVLSDIHHVECRSALLSPDFQLQPLEVFKLSDMHTKLVFICSPNNPTGNLMRRSDVLKLLEMKVMVVVDEAYIDFADTESLISLVGEYPNLIVTQTFSKAYAMAGIRLGQCFADEAVISLLKKVKMPYNVNVLTQRAAASQLENRDKYRAEVEEIVANRVELARQLEACEIVERVYPSDSNFLLVKVDNADLRYRELIAAGIVVRNRSREPLCESCLRITVGTSEENKKLMAMMKGFRKAQ